MTADRVPRVAEFAALLRERRRAAALTQADLASRAGLAVRTVRDLERGRTARPRRATAELLARALGLTGAGRAQLLAAARGGPYPLDGPDGVDGGRVGGHDPATGVGVPLPPPVALVGREEELSRLAAAVAAADGAPVTLVGLAGVGKSALAVALAHRLVDAFPGGVAGVVVDEAGEPADLLGTVLFVFGARDLAELAGRLAKRPALLVLDAVERDPAKVRAALARLPAAIRVVGAGRAPLGLPDERVWPVPPLEVPPASATPDLAEVARYPAVALFLERLARVRPEPLAADEVPALVGLVRRLDGLPLALELAAGHARLLRVPEILRRHGEGSLELEPVRASVAASYRMLTPPERQALRRLAAFRNRWSVELAEQMLDGGDPLRLLDRLVSLGLVGVRGARERRFRLLDVVRDFATERAEQRGELTRIRRAHAAVMARLAARTAPPPGAIGASALATLDDLASDVWAALTHAANDDPHTALRLAAALPAWWRLRGREAVGHRWLRRLLDDPRTADAEPALRAWAVLGAADLSGDPADVPAVERALTELRQAGDVAGEVAGHTVLRRLWRARGGHAQARAQAEAAVTVAVRAGRWREAAAAELDLAEDETRVGDLEAARGRLAVADRLAAQSGDRWPRLAVGVGLAEVARLAGRYEEALAIGQRVLVRLSGRDDAVLRFRALGTVGRALAALGRVDDGERALASLRAGRAAGVAVDGWCAAVDAWLALARGDRAAAAERFAVAAAAFQPRAEPRELVEALAGLAGCTVAPGPRGRVLARLEQVAHEAGVVLLPQDLALRDGRWR